ncbi:unnamed protein product [[Actinomadura] parvosata subsp. kistnae]|nr:unnamed protein product [Actinomadura parvosata subsp. kistnae]
MGDTAVRHGSEWFRVFDQFEKGVRDGGSQTGRRLAQDVADREVDVEEPFQERSLGDR